MRIALIYDAVFPYVKGGAERIFAEVSRRLAARHEVHIFGFHYWAGPAHQRREDGVWLHGVAPATELYRNGRRSLPAALRLALRLPWSLMRQGRFDVIDIMSIPYFPIFTARLVATLTRAPLVVTWLEYWRGHWKTYLPRGAAAAELIEWLSTCFSPRIIAISEHTRAGMLRAGVAPGRIDLVTPGIDWARMQEIEPAPQGADVLYVGRLVRDKRVDLLLDAMALVLRRRPQAHCLIAGDGAERSALEARRLGLQERIRFGGFLPEAEDVYRLMKASRVFAFPSQREGFGIVTVEAAACGLPVVAVEAPNNAAALVREGGFGLVGPETPETFAEHILSILEDDAMHARLARAGREWSRQFDWDAIAARTEQVYLRAADSYRRGK